MAIRDEFLLAECTKAAGSERHRSGSGDSSRQG
jgi:hypothetical protein